MANERNKARRKGIWGGVWGKTPSWIKLGKRGTLLTRKKRKGPGKQRGDWAMQDGKDRKRFVGT